jgi:uncharacterized membrane protein
MEFGCELFGSGMLWWGTVFIGFLLVLFWPDQKTNGESAWDILHKSFAEGSLTIEEYQERKQVLEQNRKKYQN